jgi:hypothetical protein
MTEKELREIKRRFRPERSNIPKIVGCFVNGAGKNIIAKIFQSIGLGESVVNEKLLGVMKKTLSGTLGTNLTNISYSTKQVTDSEKHKLLMELLKSRLEDEGALERFYRTVIESVSFEDKNYVILLASDVYDVKSFGKDGLEDDSYTSFTYIVCAVCPVKSMPEALTFKESDNLFHALSTSTLLGSCELGFMFPTFDDRRTNIYGSLYYTRSIGENYPDFAANVLDYTVGLPPKAQRAAFGDCLSDSLGEECSFDVVRSVHDQISDMVQAHKESHDPEPLTISKATVKNILEGCGIAEEKINGLDAPFDESFGVNAELSPKNVIPVNRFEVKTPEVQIKVDPEHRDLVTTEVRGGVKYLMVKVTGGVEVNGIPVKIED